MSDQEKRVSIGESSKESEKRYKCQLCDLSFENEESFVEHGKKNHRSPPKLEEFSCDKCDKKYITAEFLQKHKKNVHEKLDTSKTGHQNIAKSLKLPQCEHCGGCFFTLNALNEHYIKFHNHLCTNCGAITKTAEELKVHMSREHSEHKEIFVCKVCGANFIDKKELLQHGENCFKCQFCVTSFNSARDLYRHIVSFCRKKDFSNGRSCPFCEDSNNFGNLDGFIVHCQIFHPDTYPFTCQECGQNYPLPQDLKEHEDEHYNKGNKRTISELEDTEDKADKRRRESGKDFTDEFKRGPSSSSTLEAESFDLPGPSTFAGPSTSSTPKQQKANFYSCKICSEIFPSSEEFELHDCPDDPNLLKCFVCSKKFEKEKELEKHCIEVHLLCDICGRKCKSREEIFAHLYYSHTH